MYQSECAPKHIRGAIVAGYQWMVRFFDPRAFLIFALTLFFAQITIGLLIAAVVVNATKDINTTACYRIPIGIQFIWAAILGGGLLVLPEVRCSSSLGWTSLTFLPSLSPLAG